MDMQASAFIATRVLAAARPSSFPTPQMLTICWPSHFFPSLPGVMRPRHIPGEHHYQHYSHGFRANPPYRLDCRCRVACPSATSPLIPLSQPPLFFVAAEGHPVCACSPTLLVIDFVGKQDRTTDHESVCANFLALALLIFVVRLKKKKKKTRWLRRPLAGKGASDAACLLHSSVVCFLIQIAHSEVK